MFNGILLRYLHFNNSPYMIHNILFMGLYRTIKYSKLQYQQQIILH
jgi:hypothetical protein